MVCCQKWQSLMTERASWFAAKNKRVVVMVWHGGGGFTGGWGELLGVLKEDDLFFFKF